MRTILIVNGKSAKLRKQFIENNNLENNLISLKSLRTILAAPMLSLKGDFQPFFQKDNEKYSYELYLSILSKRMSRGEFLVIETDSRFKQIIGDLRDLSIEYRYHAFSITCDETEINNDNKNELPKWIKPINAFAEIKNYWIENLDNKYEEIKIFGDLQGCYSVLKKAIPNGIQENTKYIFIGDFLDRGLENREVFEFMTSIQYLPNVTLIEGNHEIHLNHFAQGKTIHNSLFITETLTELLGIDKHVIKNEIKEKNITDKNQILNMVIEQSNPEQVNLLKEKCLKLYQKCNQVYLFEFFGRKFICNHGGLSAVPDLVYIPTKNLISGVGLHTDGDRISNIYKENFYNGKCQDLIQIFGHRAAQSNEVCYNLIDSEIKTANVNDNIIEYQGVEYGGKLPVLTITKENIHLDYYQNDIQNIPTKSRK